MSALDSAWIGVAQREEWRAALAGISHGFEHLPEFSSAAAKVSGHEPGLWTCAGASARAACPLVRRSCPGGGFDVATPLGFSGFAIAGELPGLADAWTSDWKARGAIAGYVQLSAFKSPAEWRALLPGLSASLHDGPDCWLWHLQRPVDDLLASMSSKHRQLLNKWLREGAEVVWDQDELLPRFQALYAQFQQRRELGAAYRYSAEALKELACAPGALLVGARGDGGDVEAVTLFLSGARQATSFLNAATETGRRHSRGLYWMAALRLRDAGVELLNLGGGLNNDDALAQFKQRLGAVRAQTLVLRQVFDSARFDHACALAGVEPRTDGFFPPWLKSPA